MTKSGERTEAVAHLKFARMGPRKLRRVADAIRGKNVKDALILLQFAGVFAAEPIEKLVRSAVANAENNHDMNADELFISKIMVDGGPGGGFTKRLDPRAQGRANFKRKRLSHVTVAVAERPAAKQARARKTETESATKAPTRRKAPARKAPARKKKTAKAGARA
jgi:large subunit ribosomal protein L22